MSVSASHRPLAVWCVLWILLALALSPTVAAAQEEEGGGGEEASGGEGGESSGPAWVEVEAAAGRKKAMFHAASLARMESWSMKIAEADLPAFQKAFEQRLTGSGYKVRGSEKVVVNGYPATLRRYSGTAHEAGFTVTVIEVYRRGELWQFSAVYKESEELSDANLVEALTGFAASSL